MEDLQFKVSFVLKRQENDEAVVHKVDGQRFSRSNTVKLNVNTAYILTVTIRPEITLRGLHIQGENIEITRIKTEKIEDDNSKYQAVWTSTGFTTNKNGNRKDVPFVLEFDHSVTMTTTLQIKFYNDTETNHAKWGSPLHNIEYDCIIKNGQTFVDIKKEKYF